MPAKKKPAKGDGTGKLSQADVNRLKQQMLQHRGKLSGDMESIKEETLKPGDQDFSVDHMADHGSDNFDQDMNFHLIENVGRTLREIDKALVRIEKGSFGTCGACGCAIPKARLEFLPWVRFCVACQTRVEQGELMVDEGFDGAVERTGGGGGGGSLDEVEEEEED